MAAGHVTKANNLVVTVCGGGNAAHVAAGMYSHNGATVNMFLPLQKEEVAWKSEAAEHGITVDVKQHGTSYTGHVNTISSDPAEVIPQAQFVVIIVPAFAHRPMLEKIGPHLTAGTVVLAMPAPGCFDLMASHVLGARVNDVIIAGTMCLPWACRIKEYARRVELLGEKTPVSLVARPSAGVGKAVQLADSVHDHSAFVAGRLFVQASLFPTNPMLHPGIMYSKWADWDGTPLEERPFFYDGVDDQAAVILEGLDTDLQAVARRLSELLGEEIALPTLIGQMVEGYGDQISDPSNYKTMLVTNSALQGLYHPMKQLPDGRWEPDFTYRYLTEDIPYGLSAMKGLAQLTGVDTPVIDKVLGWAQSKMGKEYLVEGQLVGKDVPTTASPQAFGIASQEELLQELRYQLDSSCRRLLVEG